MCISGILMSIHLFEWQHPSISDRRLLRLLAGYENGSVTLWQKNATDRDRTVEGRGWDSIWSVKLHVESGTFSLTGCSEYTSERVPMIQSWRWHCRSAALWH